MTFIFDIYELISQWLSENNVDDESIEVAKLELHSCVDDAIDDYNEILRRNADE